MFHRVRAFVWTAVVLAAACQKPESVDLPPEFHGVWTSNAPAYADRFFELRGDDTLRFGQGDGRVDVARIVRVEIHHDGKFLVYRIVHLNATGDEYVLSVRHDPEKLDELTFLNQPRIVWRKEGKQESKDVTGPRQNTEVKQ
jgi:hypothetical protein